jgi:hypothetical protein
VSSLFAGACSSEQSGVSADAGTDVMMNAGNGGATASGGGGNGGASVAGTTGRGGASGSVAGAGGSGASGSGGVEASGGSRNGNGGASVDSGGAGGDVTGGTDAGVGGAPDGSAPLTKLGAPFVAVGYATIRAASSDGKTWGMASAPAPLPSGFSGTPQDGDNQWLLRGVCTDGKKYVAVGGTGGDQGLLLVSNDAQTWNVVGGAQANDDCAYGNGIWVTPSRHSTDTATWTRASAPPQSARKIVFADGRFVSVGDQYGGNVSYTRDGDHWKALPITFVGTDADRKGYNTLAYGNGRFVALSTGRMDAPVFEWDGKSDGSFMETPRPAELAGAALYSVAYGRGAFYIASFNALFRRADGASTWEKIAGQGGREIYSLVVTAELFVDTSYWSTDGIHWTKSGATPAFGITKLIATPSG